MRSGVRAARHEEDEESAFVSMTDMTVSFLFIVMILLAFFASQFSETDQVPRSDLEIMREQRDEARRELEVMVRERDEAREEVSRLEQLLRHVRLEREQAEQQARDLTLKLEATREALTSSERALDAARLQIAELERQVEELKARLAALEHELRQLKRPDPLEEYLRNAGKARESLLEDLRQRLKKDFPDLMVEISAESDALRFQGEGLFGFGESYLRERPRRIVQSVAQRLDEILPCYTFGTGSGWSPECNPDLAVVEAVQIEGHTDDRGDDLDNLRLSTARANETFAAMVGHQTGLLSYLNHRNQPVLSVAGYGEMRAIGDNTSDDGRRANRRIDLRIIMHTPFRSDELGRIGESLRATGEAAQ